jgi:hypothetical protein
MVRKLSDTDSLRHGAGDDPVHVLNRLGAPGRSGYGSAATRV